MHKLIEYICDELEELERKAEKEGKLSMAEVQYMDTLAHTKKNLMKADEMWENSEYSMAEGSYRQGNGRSNRSYEGGQSMARGGRRGGNRRGGANQYGSYAMNGYSRNYSYGDGIEDMIETIRDSINDLPEDTKREAQKFLQKLEQAM